MSFEEGEESPPFVFWEPKKEIVNIDDLKFDPSNPNTMNDVKIESLEYSLQKWGYAREVAIDQNNLIADGEHRVRVLKERGIKQITIQRYFFENDEDRRLFRQSMNKIHGEHDLQKDISEMEILMGYNPVELNSLLGFDETGLDLMRQQLVEQEEQIHQLRNEEKSQSRGKKTQTIGNEDLTELIKDENAAMDNPLDKMDISSPDEIKSPIVQQGDIWKLGTHYLLCGDFSDVGAVNKLLGDRKVDMVFVDPPYNIMGSSNGFTKMDDDSIIQPFFKGLLNLIKRATKPNAHVYVCSNWRSYFPILKANYDVGLVPKNLIVWHKPNARLGSMYSSSHEFIIFMANDPVQKYLTTLEGKTRTVYGETNVWVYNTNTSIVREHFAQKPVVLPERALKNSTYENETVMDMCLGSGTTLMAAEQLGRVCYGIELNPKYCDITIRRWEDYTGQKAERITNNNA